MKKYIIQILLLKLFLFTIIKYIFYDLKRIELSHAHNEIVSHVIYIVPVRYLE